VSEVLSSPPPSPRRSLILIVALVETSYAMAYSDELTGLPGRRALNDLLSGQRAPGRYV